MVCGRGFRGSLSHGSAQKREAQVSRPKDECLFKFCPSIVSGKYFTTVVMAPGTDIIVDSPLAGVTLRSGPSPLSIASRECVTVYWSSCIYMKWEMRSWSR